jgi:ubiquinone/menaquinone biosynthesis C-methylase UbiE
VPVSLPYFDHILAGLRRSDPEVELAFGRFVHWGYWEDPARADGSLADYAAAAETLSRRVCDAAEVREGQRVLDVGCGFGATLADLNARLNGVDLVGVNIDDRQLQRAREQVRPRPGNRISFVTADACRLPFADGGFDVVLAVESVFHFPGRDRFLAEARRVLRPRGRMSLCDFVPRFVIPVLWDYLERRTRPQVLRLYGPSDMRCTVAQYRRLARRAGLRLTRRIDLTRGTRPTYPVLRPLVRRIAPDPDEAERVIARVEFVARIGLLRYLVLVFRPCG